MTESYIENHFADIKKYANVIEKRLDDTCCTKDSVLRENSFYLEMCKKYGCNCILIDDRYHVDIQL